MVQNVHFVHKNRLFARTVWNGGWKHLSLLGAVVILKSNSCREEGPVATLLCLPRMHQSVSEGALRFCDSLMLWVETRQWLCLFSSAPAFISSAYSFLMLREILGSLLGHETDPINDLFLLVGCVSETESPVWHSAQSLQQNHGGDPVRPQAAGDVFQSGFLWAGTFCWVYSSRRDVREKMAVFE